MLFKTSYRDNKYNNMESCSYPVLKEPQPLSQFAPRLVQQPAYSAYPVRYDNPLLLKINWAFIFNIIVVVWDTLFLLAYGKYLASVQDIPLFLYMVLFEAALIIMNVVWYFYNDNNTFNEILKVMAYSTFVLFFVGVFATILLISGTMSDMVGILVAMLFIILPTSLLGLSIWLVMKENQEEFYPSVFSQNLIKIADQEAQYIQKIENRPQFKYAPLAVNSIQSLN